MTYNYFGFEILCYLNKKITLKTVTEKKRLYLYLSLCCFMFCPNNLKLNGLMLVFFSTAFNNFYLVISSPDKYQNPRIYIKD